MKKHILIVEDDRWLADIYRDVLHKEFEITLYHDAQSAAEALDTTPPDIILLDIMLPGGNGIAFLHELRSYDDLTHVPVVVCSSVHLTEAQHQAITQFAPVQVMNKADLTPEYLVEIIRGTYAT